MDVSSLISYDQPDSFRISAPTLYGERRHMRSSSVTKRPQAKISSSASHYHRPSTVRPSPPADNRQAAVSLPSISTLLRGVDGVAGGHGHAAKRQRANPPPTMDLSMGRRSGLEQVQRTKAAHPLTPPPPVKIEPEFHSTSHSPSATSPPRTAMSLPSILGGYPSPVSEAPEGRRMSQISLHSRGTSVSQTSQFPCPEARYPSPPNLGSSGFVAPLEPSPKTEYYPPTPGTAGFPPVPLTVIPSQSAHMQPWQHHHYFHPSNNTSYPLNHDRYICRICHKAFSRPSSLRIHSHSHTGEKPFRCPHAGCGKAFSVRSNMKRHERGCHPGRTPSQTGMVN